MPASAPPEERANVGRCPRCGRVLPRDVQSLAEQAKALHELLELHLRHAGDERSLRFLVGLAAGHAQSAACTAGTCAPAAAARA